MHGDNVNGDTKQLSEIHSGFTVRVCPLYRYQGKPNYQCNGFEHIVFPIDLCNLGVEVLVEYADIVIKMFRNCGRAPLTVDVSVIGALVAVCIYLTMPSTRYIPSHIKDVGSLHAAAVTLVFFWVWHSSEQPYQVLDPESSLTVQTSLYVFARRPILATLRQTLFMGSGAGVGEMLLS